MLASDSCSWGLTSKRTVLSHPLRMWRQRRPGRVEVLRRCPMTHTDDHPTSGGGPSPSLVAPKFKGRSTDVPTMPIHLVARKPPRQMEARGHSLAGPAQDPRDPQGNPRIKLLPLAADRPSLRTAERVLLSAPRFPADLCLGRAPPGERHAPSTNALQLSPRLLVGGLCGRGNCLCMGAPSGARHTSGEKRHESALCLTSLSWWRVLGAIAMVIMYHALLQRND